MPPMWIVLALVAACSSAGTSLLLKRAVGLGGTVVSTVAFRMIAGLLLLAAFVAMGAHPTLTPTYWRTLAVVVPNEIGGMLCLSLALSRGDVSAVQPIMGLIPLFTMAGGVLFLHEMPSTPAIGGIVLVAAGLYAVGLRAGSSALDPLRAFASSAASWYALLAAIFWTVTTLLHKIGIAIVGPTAWAVSLTLGSAIALAAVLPLLAWRWGGLGVPARIGPWGRVVAAAGVCFAVQQLGLHNALRRSQAGYVMAVVSMSILIAATLGVLLFREEGGAHRISGALLVTSGVALIALFG
jgi:drug/metabolite transporter (DMT)-like permease